MQTGRSMLKDITIGQYYQAQSLIHRLDPRVKIGGTLIYVITLFFYKNFVGYAMAILFLALVIRLSKVPFKFMVKGMKSILFLLMLTVLFNLFLTPGTTLVSTVSIRTIRMPLSPLVINLRGTCESLITAKRKTIPAKYPAGFLYMKSVMMKTRVPNSLTLGSRRCSTESAG